MSRQRQFCAAAPVSAAQPSVAVSAAEEASASERPSRRAALAALVAGLAAINASPAVADEKSPRNGDVQYSDAEWRQRLSPEAYAILRQARTERRNSSPLVRVRAWPLTAELAAHTPQQRQLCAAEGSQPQPQLPCVRLQEKRTGIFVCGGCGQPLFPSEAKYESGGEQGAHRLLDDGQRGLRWATGESSRWRANLCSMLLLVRAAEADCAPAGTGWPSFYDALPKAVLLEPDYSIPFMPRVEVSLRSDTAPACGVCALSREVLLSGHHPLTVAGPLQPLPGAPGPRF
jgi:peptide methionine sulfoxide reductase MsrB